MLRATRPPAQEYLTNVLCPPGHDTTASFKTRAPVSFKRMLDGALFTDARARRAPLGARARPWDENLTMGSHPTEGRARRGRSVARPWGVGRGAQILLREHRRSAPRVLTVQKDLTKGCLWGGSAPPNGSRLSCGRPARWRKAVGRSPCPARGTTLRFLQDDHRPSASSAC